MAGTIDAAAVPAKRTRGRPGKEPVPESKATMGKREFCHLLAVRLRNKNTQNDFYELAKLYALMRGWLIEVGRKPRHPQNERPAPTGEKRGEETDPIKMI